jgi:hypothetical protein
MSNSIQHSPYNSLLIEIFADTLYFDRLSEAIFERREYGPHLLLGSAIALSYAFRTPLLLAEPWRFTTSLSIVGGLWLGLIGARYMRNGYEDAIDHLRLEQRPTEYDHSQFATIVSFRMQAAIYVLALVGIYINFFGFGVETLIAEEGTWPVVVRWLIALPLAYVPIIIDVGTMFLGVHFLLPRRLEKADLNLFFYDPRNMGGFAPIGQLLKRAYYVYTGGLLAYFFFIYIPIIFSGVIDSTYEVGTSTTVFFSVAWLIGVVSIGYSMWKVHTLMAGKKERRLKELEDDLRDVIENPYDIRNSTVTDEGKRKEIVRQLDHVRGMKEYPTTFTMWSQILISVILPQVLNMTIQVAG